MNKDKDVTKGFFEEVSYHGWPWIVHIRHYLSLTAEEIKRYEVQDGQFLVHMYCIHQSNMFKVFLDEEEPLLWRTDADALLIDSEMVQVIGNRIDLKHS